MAYLLPNCLILHIPKTGSDWVRAAGLYWIETGRFPPLEHEPRVENEVFEHVVRNCMAVEPQGYLSKLYERYSGNNPGDFSHWKAGKLS